MIKRDVFHSKLSTEIFLGKLFSEIYSIEEKNICWEICSLRKAFLGYNPLGNYMVGIKLKITIWKLLKSQHLMTGENRTV